MLGIISNIQRFTVHDGPGIRLTVFFQGCPLACWWCHNPECIKIYKVEGHDEHLRLSVDDLMREIKKEQIFIDESGGGVTFSGGEPMMQHLFLEKMLEACNMEGIHTAVDTSGLVPTDVFNSFIDKTDLFLYDLKIIDPELHQKYTGASNKLILKNLEALNNSQKNVIIRVPLIPGITDTDKNIEDILTFLEKFPHIKNVNLLPYHTMAQGKYEKLGMAYKLKGIKVDDDRKNEIKKRFINAGLNAEIGG